MRDKIEYLGVKADFFKGQTIPIGEFIYRMELRVEKTLKEEQEVNDKLLEGAEVKENLEGILGSLRNQQKVENHGKKDDEAATRINGFYHCLECPFKAKCSWRDLKVHINAVHRKLKPWKCLECPKRKPNSISDLTIFKKYFFQCQVVQERRIYHHIV